MELEFDGKESLVLCLQDRPEILFALLYGSAVEGGHFRDLDIGLFVDRAHVPVTDDLDYAFGLADELENTVPYPVDVRVINDAPLPFRYNVSRGIVLVVNDGEALAHFLERTWDEFFDFRPVAMQYLKEMR
jgi:predicted nucleotidyltransferase